MYKTVMKRTALHLSLRFCPCNSSVDTEIIHFANLLFYTKMSVYMDNNFFSISAGYLQTSSSTYSKTYGFQKWRFYTFSSKLFLPFSTRQTNSCTEYSLSHQVWLPWLTACRCTVAETLPKMRSSASFSFWQSNDIYLGLLSPLNINIINKQYIYNLYIKATN